MLSQKLKALRKQRGITQEMLAKAIQVERSSVGKYESANVIPSPGTLLALAKYFNVTTDFLLSNTEDTTVDLQQGTRVPILGHVTAGIPIEAIKDIIGYEEVAQNTCAQGEFFGLRIVDSSMEPRIQVGDIAIVRKQPDIDSGSVAVVLINGEDAVVKRVVKHKDGISLISYNGAFAPHFYTYGEVRTLPVEIVGEVIEIRGKP